MPVSPDFHGKKGMPRIATREVVELIADRMACGAHKGDLKRLVREVAGKLTVTRTTYETIFTRARALLLIRSGQSKGDHKRDAINFYRSIVRDEDQSTHNRIAAQKQLDEVLGIAAKYTGSGPSSEDAAARVRALLKTAEGSVGEEPILDDDDDSEKDESDARHD